jgi:hypothetical protein
MAQQTAVEWLIKEIKNFDSGRSEYYSKVAIYNHAIRMEKEQMTELVQRLKDYTAESHNILGHDEREASEFVEEYYNETYNK